MLSDIVYSKQFKKDYKLAQKRGLDANILSTVVRSLFNEEPLDAKYKDHPLRDSKKYKGARECHLQPDWLLVYRVDGETLVLTLVRTGTHSDLF